jgi:hypothetical protein
MIALAVLAGCGNSQVSQCRSSCDRQAAANCSGFNVTSCRSSCDSLGSADSGVPAACNSALNAALSCLSSATYTCDPTTNLPTSTMCQSEAFALISCALSNSDSGAPPQDATPGD